MSEKVIDIKEKQEDRAPQIRGIHPEKMGMIKDQIINKRIQSTTERSRSSSTTALNYMIKTFRASKKYAKHTLRTKVCRFDENSCIVRCRIVSPDGATLSEAHAAWDKDLVYSAEFLNCSPEDIELFQATANRDRLEMTENIAISRALRFLGF